MAVAEAKLAVSSVFDRVAAFVDEAVVLPAEQDQVVQAGLAAMRPVPAVMRGQMVASVAAGPAADALVACLDELAESWWHGAAFAADCVRDAVLLDAGHVFRVAAEPPSGFCADHRAVLELTPAHLIVRERCGIDVHHQPGRLRRAVSVGPCEGGLGQLRAGRRGL